MIETLHMSHIVTDVTIMIFAINVLHQFIVVYETFYLIKVSWALPKIFIRLRTHKSVMFQLYHP